MAYLGSQPSNQTVVTSQIVDGNVTPAKLSTGAPTWDTSGNTSISGQLRSTAAATPPTFADSTGTQIGTLCRAWVNFNGTNATKNGSFNVSSIVRSNIGTYTVNFTNALVDANYSCLALGSNQSSNGAQVMQATNYTTGSVGLNNAVVNVTTADQTTVSVAIFR